MTKRRRENHWWIAYAPLLAAFCITAAAAEDGAFVALFDRRTLDGWTKQSGETFASNRLSRSRVF
ncbi:MAG: hypothetical protein AAF961_01745, partial [Planctomycetota bacterium]